MKIQVQIEVEGVNQYFDYEEDKLEAIIDEHNNVDFVIILERQGRKGITKAMFNADKVISVEISQG